MWVTDEVIQRMEESHVPIVDHTQEDPTYYYPIVLIYVDNIFYLSGQYNLFMRI